MAAEVNLTIEQGAALDQQVLFADEYRFVADAAMTASSATLTSQTAKFTAADVGRTVRVRGAGASRGILTTTISSVTNSTTAVLAAAATFSVSGASLEIYLPIDLTGYTARMQIRQTAESSTFLAELTNANGGITLGGTAGTVTIVMTAAVTAALTAGRAVYDLELVPPNSKTIRWLAGTVNITREITR